MTDSASVIWHTIQGDFPKPLPWTLSRVPVANGQFDALGMKRLPVLTEGDDVPRSPEMHQIEPLEVYVEPRNVNVVETFGI